MTRPKPAPEPPPPRTDEIAAEDRRQGGALAVSISSYVATAALAVLAGAFALFTFVSQNFEPTTGFYVLIVFTGLLLVASIFVGGKGSQETIARITDGTWPAKERNKQYAWQAALTLLGLFFLAAAAAFGLSSTKESSDLETRIERIAEEVGDLTKPVSASALDERQLWLEHLIATSDYRIDRLLARSPNGSKVGPTALEERTLTVEKAARHRQCEVLAALPGRPGIPGC